MFSSYALRGCLLGHIGATLLSLASAVAGQDDGRPWLDPKTIELFEHTQVDLDRLAAELPFERFVEAVVEQLPREPRSKVRIDRASFGKDWSRIAAVRVQRPAFLKKVTATTALKIACSQAKADVEWAYGPDGVTVVAGR